MPATHLTTVHCRTGSLEITKTCEHGDMYVHCRTGSLENKGEKAMSKVTVHCRTGSLEIVNA
ncbi:hypothetical protein FORC76_0716 [Vibrio cholerae]|nr:hypothetical protein FORC76_0716 [Vibrio cholerae]